MSKLTPKQERFVQEYLVDYNATQAAIRAGFSVKTAAEQGHQLLQKTSVAQAIAERKECIASKLDISAERILEELARVAFARINQVVEWDESSITAIPSDELGPEASAALRSIDITEKTFSNERDESTTLTRKFTMHDKVRALELLGKHRALFVERHEHTGKDGEPLSFVDLVAKAKANRAKGDGSGGAHS